MILNDPKVVQEILLKEGRCTTMPESELASLTIIAERIMEITEGLNVDVDLLADSADCINEGKMFCLILDYKNNKVSTNYYPQ